MPHAQMIQQHPASEGLAPAIVRRALAAPGRPLDAEVRRPLEARLGHDFSTVRVHQGEAAAAAAAAIGARAYAVGRDIVFGAGQYAPRTVEGRALLAHELAHAMQQPARPRHDEALRLGRRGDAHERHAAAWSRGSLLPPAARAAPAPVAPIGGQLVQCQPLSESVIGLLPTAYQQAARDLRDSVTESPQYFVEFFADDLLVAIREHWLKILAITLGFVAAEELIAILAAAPTGISQLVAAILQVLVLAILGYFAAAETADAVKEGMRWISVARNANGGRARIADASRAFVRMIWHIVMAIIAIAGVRVKVRGLAAQRAAAAARAAETGVGGGAGVGGTAARGGGEVVDIASHPGFRPAGTTPPSTGPTASAFEGGAARRLAPEPVPLRQPLAPPQPVSPTTTSPSALARPVKPARLTVGATGAAVAVERARTEEEEKEERKRHPTMRHQIQRGDEHLSSVAVAAADPRRGVTARELRGCMADNFAAYMALAGRPGRPRRPVEYERPIRSGIIWQSQQLPGLVAAGGVSQGGDINALRWCFGDRSLAEVPCRGRDIGEERVRLDVENNGQNLRYID